MFFVGESELPIVDDDFRDVLPCAVRDDYSAIWEKTRAMCQWALACRDWNYLFHADDDTYVHVPRWQHAAADLRDDYVGRALAHDWWPFEYASGGAGWWLSRRAVAIVSERLGAHVGRYRVQGRTIVEDDVLVGRVLRDAGMAVVDDPRYDWTAAATLRADQITAHWLGPSAMLALHRSV